MQGRILAYIFIFLSLVITTSCVNPVQNDVMTNPSLSNTGDDATEITLYDIESVADSFDLESRSGSGSSSGHVPPIAGRHHHDIIKGLKKLLEGPCLKNSDKIFEALLDEIDKRIQKLSDLLIKESDPDKIEKLQKRIDLLEKLEEEIKLKKEECAKGISNCSDKFKEGIIREISRVEDKIKDLDTKIANEKDPKKKEHLEKLVERLEKVLLKLKDVLAKC